MFSYYRNSNQWHKTNEMDGICIIDMDGKERQSQWLPEI